MMQIHALHHREHGVGVFLKRTDRAGMTDHMFQHLQDGTRRQFTQGEEEGQSELLPQHRQQRQHIQGTLCQDGEILEECILNPRMMGVQHQV